MKKIISIAAVLALVLCLFVPALAAGGYTVTVINGMDGLLNPQGYTTRAQIARVLQQFCEIKPDMV